MKILARIQYLAAAITFTGALAATNASPLDDWVPCGEDEVNNAYNQAYCEPEQNGQALSCKEIYNCETNGVNTKYTKACTYGGEGCQSWICYWDGTQWVGDC
jgi:hypothetical protein